MHVLLMGMHPVPGLREPVSQVQSLMPSAERRSACSARAELLHCRLLLNAEAPSTALPQHAGWQA